MLPTIQPLSIQAKLRCIAVVLLLGMAVIGGTFWVALSRTQAVTEEVVKQTAVLSQLQSADMSHDGLRSVVYASFLVGQLPQVSAAQVREDGRDHAQNMREAMAGVVAAVQAADVDPKLRAQLVAVADLARRYLDTADTLINTALTDRTAAQVALPIFDTLFSELQHAYEEPTAALRTLNQQAIDNAYRGKAIAQADQQALLTALVMLALMLLAVKWVGYSIRHSLQNVADVASAVAAGDLARRYAVDVRDEVGDLGVAVNGMADKLQAMLGHALADSSRHNFSNELNVALEMADSEPEAYRVVQRAMLAAAPDRPMELLVSDSSQAVLQRATEHPTAGAPGCGVDSPFSCQAVRRGNSVSFPNSEALDACPRLRDRPGATGPLSAVCVPLHFMGRALGVLHAVGPKNAHMPADQMAQMVARLGVIGNQAAARIGVVRAFERSQLQAATDSATGLANRRSFEAALRELLRKKTPFALVMADLDRFKILNDTYGHLAGDEALRLFADSIKAGARGQDTVARWGGEEFALLLVGSDAKAALEWAERARGQLALALMGSKVPRFTASFGIADSGMSDRLEELLRIADEALYKSKDQGRDRSSVGSAVAANEPRLRQPSDHAERMDASQMMGAD